jgi:hypothetical protein
MTAPHSRRHDNLPPEYARALATKADLLALFDALVERETRGVGLREPLNDTRHELVLRLTTPPLAP